MAFSKAAFQAFLVIVLVGAVYGSKKVHGMNVVHGSSKVYGVFENPLLGYVKGKVNSGLDKDQQTFILLSPKSYYGQYGGYGRHGYAGHGYGRHGYGGHGYGGHGYQSFGQPYGGYGDYYYH